MTVDVRLLTDEDFERLDDFLAPYTLTSMFMRSNIRRAGVTFKPDTDFSAHYYGVFDPQKLQGQKLQGVVALNWNGTLFVQIPDLTLIADVLKTIITRAPDFALGGVLGPEDQTQVVLTVLKLTVDHFTMSKAEICYDLLLQDLQLPLPLILGEWLCRRAVKKDLEILVPWRRGYDQEALGLDASLLETPSLTTHKINNAIEQGDVFVLDHQGTLVSQANYNATLEETVQIGGVWTPPDLRGQGYAQSVVAGALQAAAQAGKKTSILFTSNPIARHVYEKLGFKARALYHLSLLKKPLSLREIIT